MTETRTRTRTVDLGPGRSVAITLTEAGPEVGAGRTALVLHGGGGPMTVQSIAEHLSGTTHIVIPVHPGWNCTPRPGWLSTVTDLAAAYLRLLEDEGLRDVLVIGSSMGGWIGADMAARQEGHLIAGLVLIDSVGVLVEGQPIRDFFALDARGVAEYSYARRARRLCPQERQRLSVSSRCPGSPKAMSLTPAWLSSPLPQSVGHRISPGPDGRGILRRSW